MTLKIWRPYIDEDGCQLRGGDINMAELDGGWEGIEDTDKPNLVMRFPQLKQELLALGRIIEYQVLSQIQLRYQRHTVAYLMVVAVGLGSVSVLLG